MWFTEAVGRPCTLIRCFGSENVCCRSTSGRLGMCRDVQSKLNFVNEAQLLLVSEESVSNLNSRIISSMFFLEYSFYLYFVTWVNLYYFYLWLWLVEPVFLLLMFSLGWTFWSSADWVCIISLSLDYVQLEAHGGSTT